MAGCPAKERTHCSERFTHPLLLREEIATAHGRPGLRMEFPGGRSKEAPHRRRLPDAQFAPGRLTEQAVGASGGDEFDAPATN